MGEGQLCLLHPRPSAPSPQATRTPVPSLWASAKGSALAFSISDSYPPHPQSHALCLHWPFHRLPPQVLQGHCPAPRPGLPGRGHRVHHLRRGGEASQQSVEDGLSPGVCARAVPSAPSYNSSAVVPKGPSLSRVLRGLGVPCRVLTSSVVCIHHHSVCVQLRLCVPLACESARLSTCLCACVPCFVSCDPGCPCGRGHVPARCLPPWAAGAVPRPTTAASGPQPGLTAFQGLRGPRFSRHWP